MITFLRVVAFICFVLWACAMFEASFLVEHVKDLSRFRFEMVCFGCIFQLQANVKEIQNKVEL